MNRYTCLWIRKLNIFKMFFSAWSLDSTHFQLIIAKFSERMYKLILKFEWKRERPWTTKIILTKKTKMDLYHLICRWHHPYGRKWGRTKEPLHESERGEWKSWLKARHSENEDHGIRCQTVSDFILGGSKITADGKDSYSSEEKLWPN